MFPCIGKASMWWFFFLGVWRISIPFLDISSINVTSTAYSSSEPINDMLIYITKARLVLEVCSLQNVSNSCLCHLELYVRRVHTEWQLSAHVSTLLNHNWWIKCFPWKVRCLSSPGKCMQSYWAGVLAHPSTGASPASVPWNVAFTCFPAMVPCESAQFQALQSYLQVLKCWSAKFTKGKGKQSKCGRKDIDGWCWWTGRNDAFLSADTAGTTWMEVMDTQ